MPLPGARSIGTRSCRSATPLPVQLNAEFGASPKGCAQKPYDYSPDVLATLILAADRDSNQPLPGTKPIATKRLSVSHERHHEVLVL